MAKRCNVCGATMEEDDVFCDSCGSKYEENSQTQARDSTSYFEQLEQKIKNSTSENELQSLREEIKRTQDNQHDIEYLTGLLNQKISSLYMKKEASEIDSYYNNSIRSCNSLEDFIKFRKEISDSSYSERGKYKLQRQLREYACNTLNDTVEMGKKINTESRGEAISCTVGCIFFAAVFVGINHFAKGSDIKWLTIYVGSIKIEWLALASKWIGIIFKLGAAASLIWFIYELIRWTASSSTQKNASNTVASLKKNDLFFDRSEYIYPDSDIRYLRKDEIVSGQQLDLAMKEMYVRHGMKFLSDDNSSTALHFKDKSWYKSCPEKTVIDSMLNEYEVANLNLMAQAKGGSNINYINYQE
ncbi:MAG: DUF2116 family Zn-ribbon domain-containing protein [Clostridiales bacterium]|nr:DUF2116 family Zn-ribbon domain-containing protein [Clostridiales bacterium]